MRGCSLDDIQIDQGWLSVGGADPVQTATTRLSALLAGAVPFVEVVDLVLAHVVQNLVKVTENFFFEILSLYPNDNNNQ